MTCRGLLILALWWVVVATMGNMCEGFGSPNVGPLRKWHVKVVNRLSTKESIRVHCYSTDDNLGFRTLWPGQFITWHFKINFWQTTLFGCDIWKGKIGTKAHLHASFKAFNAKEAFYEGMACTTGNNGNWCVWEARDDGVSPTTNGIRFNWETDDVPLPPPWKSMSPLSSSPF